MELRHLRYVIAVAEELHFGRAARRLKMSQPPLSQQIRGLEEELGVKLFHRTNRHVKLTDAGSRLVEEGRRALAQVEHAAKAAIGANNGQTGRLAIGTASEKQFLNDALRTFGKRYPNVRLELRTLNTMSQLQALREGRIDLGILPLPIDDTSLIVEKITRHRMMLALPAGHHLAAHNRIPWRALKGEPFIVSRTASPAFYEKITRLCRRAGFDLRVAHEVDNPQTILSFVACGFGIGFFPAMGQRKTGIVFRELAPPVLWLETALAYKRESDSEVLRSFLTVVRKFAKQ